MSGYSGTPLAKKLGLKDGLHALLNAVPETLPEISRFQGYASVDTQLEPGLRDRDYIHVFASHKVSLEQAMPVAIVRLKADGVLWISWPKKASKMPTDITEDTLREIILPLLLVDVKVCAVDEVWSGLKFMWRKEHRANVI